MAEERNTVNLQLKWNDPRSGEAMEQIFSLPFTVGRDSGNQLMLPSTSVSRKHATFQQEGQQIRLIDHQSSNGTFVNGQQVEESILKDGDELIFGEVKVQLSLTHEKEKRPSRPTRDHLFDALYKGESEKTISLKDIRGKSSALFADISEVGSNPAIESPKPTSSPASTTDIKPLSGDDLKNFISGKLQKDMAQDISDEIDTMASGFRKPSPSPLPAFQPRAGSEEDTVPNREEFEAMRPPKPSSAPPPQKPEGLIARIFRRLIGN